MLLRHMYGTRTADGHSRPLTVVHVVKAGASRGGGGAAIAPAAAAAEQQPQTFAQLGVAPALIEALEHQAITVPTEIQVGRGGGSRATVTWWHCVFRTGAAAHGGGGRAGLPASQALAFPAIMKGGSYFLASHTGSGKTLAYLVPLVSALPRVAGCQGSPPLAAGGAARSLGAQAARQPAAVCLRMC